MVIFGGNTSYPLETGNNIADTEVLRFGECKSVVGCIYMSVASPKLISIIKVVKISDIHGMYKICHPLWKNATVDDYYPRAQASRVM